MSTTQQLSEQEKRVKIAEECGWTEVHEAKRHHDSPHTVGLHPMKFGSGSAYEEIPDFFHDLNAMAEAEKVLGAMDDPLQSSPQPSDIYEHHLCLIVLGRSQWENGKWIGVRGDSLALSMATAAQRAEAFGLALNLWT